MFRISQVNHCRSLATLYHIQCDMAETRAGQLIVIWFVVTICVSVCGSATFNNGKAGQHD